ncbi:MAG: Uma2 family endonuclease [Gemmatimonadota bacterium]
MKANRSRTRWTYAEFARLPSETGTRYEIIDGELVVTPSPSVRHQRIVTDLVTLLNTFVRSNDLGQLFSGPLDVLFAEGDYLEPDVVFVGHGKAKLVSERGIEGPPDLVVEVASPSTAKRDRGIKLDRYRHFGVREYWMVDGYARTLEVWDLARGAETARVLGETDRLAWTPVDGGPTLEVDVGAILGSA